MSFPRSDVDKLPRIQTAKEELMHFPGSENELGA